MIRADHNPSRTERHRPPWMSLAWNSRLPPNDKQLTGPSKMAWTPPSSSSSAPKPVTGIRSIVSSDDFFRLFDAGPAADFLVGHAT